MLSLDGRQRILGRSSDYFSSHFEARTMARAIPRALGVIPVHVTAHVRAHGGTDVDFAVQAAIGGSRLAVHVDDFPGTASDSAQRMRVLPGKPIANQIVRIIL